MSNKEVAKQYIGQRGYTDHPLYRTAMIAMRFEEFGEEDVLYFKSHYALSKDIFSRNQILQAFVLRCLQYDLKDFFLAAFNKERYMDMRLTAVRGYAAYATEQEVIPLMRKWHQILLKIPEHTPYNYQTYEMLRSDFGLVYLVQQYGYDCFTQAKEQLNKQYDAMPDECKGFFTLDSNGVHVPLLSDEEITMRLKKLLKNN